MRKFVYPYHMASMSAKKLRDGLGCKMIKRKNSQFVGTPDTVVINWGSSTMSGEAYGCKVVNPPELVAVAKNKLKAFTAMSGKVNIPGFTTDAVAAKAWLNDGEVVYARNTVTGSGGKGIEVLYDRSDLTPEVEAHTQLYTAGVRNDTEYRVHASKEGDIIFFQRKSVKFDTPANEVDPSVRNHKNGFFFQQNGFVVPNAVFKEAVKAVKAIGLDFGAVDVAYDELNDKAVVLEVNTAPGITGKTVPAYVNYLQKYFA